MKRLLFLALALTVSTMGACSGSRSDDAPAPASVKIDSTGVTVDTSTP
jgi:nitrous oxide reductase accessory protein NosL